MRCDETRGIAYNRDLMLDGRMSLESIGTLLTAMTYIEDREVSEVTPHELSEITKESEGVLAYKMRDLAKCGYMSFNKARNAYSLTEMAVA